MTTPTHTANHTRLYVVTRRDDSGITHIVRANGHGIAQGCRAALHHVASSEYEVHHATVEDLVRLLPDHPVEAATVTPG